MATPSNGALPLSSEIDSRFFETKGKNFGKGSKGGKNGTEWKDDIDWAKCKVMDKLSDEFDKECGAKGDKWKGEKGSLEGTDSRTQRVTRSDDSTWMKSLMLSCLCIRGER